MVFGLTFLSKNQGSNPTFTVVTTKKQEGQMVVHLVFRLVFISPSL